MATVTLKQFLLSERRLEPVTVDSFEEGFDGLHFREGLGIALAFLGCVSQNGQSLLPPALAEDLN